MKKTPTIKFVWRKFVLSALITAPLATLPSPLWALPGNQTQLNAQISAATPGITITSYSPILVSVVAPADKGVVKWINFGNGTAVDPTGAAMTILAGDTISFTLPLATSSILNTVLGPGGAPVLTNIAGTISSNGIVNILNPAGIVVGPTAAINTAGLVLSTVPEAEFTFQATGSLGYSGYPSAGVQVNGGTINVNAVGSTGSVYLAGSSVDVSGTIVAGTLSVNAKPVASGGLSGNVRLAVTGPLTLGAIATTPDALGNYTSGYGNLTVNTVGGSVDLTYNAGTSVYGGTATINTNNGSVKNSFGGKVASIAVTTPGTLYTVAPTITLGLPAGVTVANGGIQATAVPVMDSSGNIASISITNPGDGYIAAPTVTVTPGTNTGGTVFVAAATAPVTAPASLPVFLVGDGQGAANVNINAGTGTVTLNNVNGNGKVFQTGIIGNTTSITGSGDIQLKASTIIDANSAANALTVLDRDNTLTSTLTVTNGATGYTVAVVPAVTTTPAPALPGGTLTAVTLVANANGTLSTAVTPGSGYTAGAAVTVAPIYTTAATTAAVAFGTGSLTQGALNTALTSGGTGYIAIPSSVVISAPGGTGNTTATAHAVMSSTPGVLALALDNPGLGYTANPTITITYPTYATTTTGGGSITNGGDVNVTGGQIALTANSADKGITFKGPGDLTFATLSATGSTRSSITLTSTTGQISLPAMNSKGGLSVTAATSIVQTGIITNSSTGNADQGASSATFDAQTGSITLNTFTNVLNQVIVKDAPGGATILSSAAMSVGAGTATGPVTLQGAGIQLGRTTQTNNQGSSSDKLTFNSTLTLISTGGKNVTETTDNALVFGTLTIDTTGAITLAGNLGTGVNLNNQYGNFVIGQTSAPSSVKIFEKTTLNMGATTVAGQGSLSLLSTGGNIVNSGPIVVGGPVLLGAGTGVAPGNINLDYTTTAVGTGNRIGGIISFYDDAGLSGATGYVGNYLVNNVTIVNELSTTLNSVVNTLLTGGIAGTLNITSGYAGSATLDTIKTVPVTAGGTNYTSVPLITVSAPNVAGGRQATATATASSGVVTAVNIADPGSGYTTAPIFTIANPNGSGYTVAPTITFSGGGATTNATAIAVLGAGGIVASYTIGSVGAGYTAAPTVTISGGTLGAGGTAAVAPAATVAAGGLIGLTLPQGSGLTLGTPTQAGPSINLGVATSSGAVTSVGGSQVNVAGNVTLAATDSITATSSSNKFGPIANITAGGNVLFTSANALTVNGTLAQLAAGNKTASFTSGAAFTIGTFTSNYTGLPASATPPIVATRTPSITFASGGSKDITDSVAGIAIYGDVNFKSSNAISITKTGHNFGGITASSGNNTNITITESGTSKYVSVNSGKGNVVLTSTNGDIIQSTDATVQNGITLADNNGANSATFNAPNGKVTIDNTNGKNAWADAVLNVTALGDVLLKGARSDITLGNITTSGKLTVDMTSSGTVTGVAAPVIGTGGSGYYVNAGNSSVTAVTVPVTFTGGGATTAATGNAMVDASGAITGVTITSNGSGYTAVPTVTVPAPVAGTGATIAAGPPTAVATGANFVVTAVALAVGGNGSKYTAAPAVTLVGGVVAPGGVPATAVAILNPATGAVSGISITNEGLYSTAPASATIAAPVAASVGTITLGTVTVAGIGAGIKEQTGTKINEYDTVTMKTINGYINVSNTGNKFGGAVLNVGNGAGLAGTGDIALTEFTTLNLKSVQTNTNFTAVSEGYDIISTTDGTIASNSLNIGGNTTLTASNGGINAYLSGSGFGGSVYLTSKNDASVLDTAVATLSLGNGSVVGGALTARNTYYYVNPITLAITTGVITQNGPVKVTGAVLFDASSGSISMSDPNNQFGGIRFMAGGTGATGGAKISELTTMNLTGGSISTGPVQLSTSGDFITTAPGGTSVTNDLVINAGGKITPGAGSLTVTGTLTVISNSGIDLSKLSLSGNLLGKPPVNLGTGTYIPPSP
jgi:fibronectin-binding autotransporter adhesin